MEIKKSIRDLFGVDYLLGPKEAKEPDKLSDCVRWKQDADQLLTNVLNRIRDTIRDKAKERAYKDNRVLIHKGDIFAILQELKLYYYDSED